MKATVEGSGVRRRTNIARARRGAKKDPVTRDIGIRTILVPIDFSRASLQAIEWAKFMAQDGRGSIHLVHAHDLQYPLVLPISPPIVLSDADIQDRLRRDLISVATKYGIAEPDAHCHIRTGPAFDQICKLADEIYADLIVTSTHGYTGWKHVFLGSTAERVVRHAPCPVLVARRSKTAAARKPRLKKILVPIDFSEHSLKGLRFAVKLAQSFNAKLVLLHAVHLDYHATADGYAMYAETELRKHMREAADTQMRALIRTTDFGGVAFDTAIRAGFPEEEICQYAQKNSADLIVTSTHGRTGLRHVLIGSTAEHIVRYAKGPVLIVPNRFPEMNGSFERGNGPAERQTARPVMVFQRRG